MAPHLFHAELARSRGGQGGRPRCLVDDGRTRPKLVRCWWSCPCPPRHPPRGSSRAVDVEVVRHALAFSGAGAGSFAYTPRGAVIESRGETGHGGRVVRIFSRSAPVARVRFLDAAAATTCAGRVTATT